MTTIKTIQAKRLYSDEYFVPLAGSRIDDSFIHHPVVDCDCDGYEAETGKPLFKFRKGRIPMETLQLAYDNFKDSIVVTEGRGMMSGKPFKRVRNDGTLSNTSIAPKATSGNVGYMDSSGMAHYCRMTSFAREHFDKFQAGIPFVQQVDRLYEEICPEHYRLQKIIARATNRNYIIGDTSFTTVTVNKNMQAAIHKDGGDYQKGFGNLIVHRDDSYTGGLLVLPEFGVAIDLQNTDILFVDVHRWHANTPLVVKQGYKEPFRISYVLYYREYMYQCKTPAEELKRVKIAKGGFFRL